MPIVSAADLPSQKAEIPPNFYESAIIRCTKTDFGPSKRSNKPMITAEWEVCGVRNKTDKLKVDTSVERGGVVYHIAGLNIKPKYHVLSPEALKYYKAEWSKFTGRPETEFSVDTENPDRTFFNKLVMSAVIKAVKVTKTRELSEEEEAAGVSNVVVDEDGKPLSYTVIEIDTFNRRFEGEVAPF